MLPSLLAQVDFGAVQNKLDSVGFGRSSISYFWLVVILIGAYLMRDKLADAFGVQLVKKGEAAKTPAAPSTPAASPAGSDAPNQAASGGRPSTDQLYRTMVDAGAPVDKVDVFIKDNWEKVRPQQQAK